MAGFVVAVAVDQKGRTGAWRSEAEIRNLLVPVVSVAQVVAEKR